MSKIKIFSLGGLNESGKNMYVVDVDNDLFIFDAGLKYADDKMLGVDYIIPDLKFLKDNLKRIKGIFITHAHEKYMGAVSDIVKNIPKNHTTLDFKNLEILSIWILSVIFEITENTTIINTTGINIFAIIFPIKLLTNNKIGSNTVLVVILPV